ncbi:MAG: PilZ domain-containing protein [Desulfobacterales bacterium]|nr:PilZ domain-containing protein [Desulfobacterales bacterium]
MKNDRDRRKRLRLDFNAKVILKTKACEQIIDANSRNISMGGLYIKTVNKPPKKTICEVEIILSGKNSDLIMRTEGQIIRHDTHGFAVEFVNDLEWWAIFSIYSQYGKNNGSLCQEFNNES